jgi:hypothetical protein
MTPTTQLVMGIVWLMFAGACIAVMCRWARRLMLLSRRGRSAVARIVQCELKHDGADAAWFSTFAFCDVRGREISVRRSLSTGKFKEGQQVSIIYDPKQPDRLRVSLDFEFEWFVGFLVFTLAHGCVALFIIRQAFKS